MQVNPSYWAGMLDGTLWSIWRGNKKTNSQTSSGYQNSKTRGSTEICYQVGHRPLVIRLSGPNPTHELAPSCYTSKEAEAATMQTHPPRRIRHTSFSFHTPSHPSPRLHHCMALHCPNTRTSAHLHSFLPSTVKLWNELSSELISLHTQVTFKSWLLSSVF